MRKKKLCNLLQWPWLVSGKPTLFVYYKSSYFDETEFEIWAGFWPAWQFTVVQPTNRVGTLGYDALPPLSGACQKTS